MPLKHWLQPVDKHSTDYNCHSLSQPARSRLNSPQLSFHFLILITQVDPIVKLIPASNGS